MNVVLSPRLARWRAAWQSLDPARIRALYAAQAAHETPAVARALPGHRGNRLQGADEIGAFVNAACARLRALAFEPLRAFEDGATSVFEYRRTFNNDTAAAINVCEVIEWEGDQVIASRVYHA